MSSKGVGKRENDLIDFRGLIFQQRKSVLWFSSTNLKLLFSVFGAIVIFQECSDFFPIIESLQ